MDETDLLEVTITHNLPDAAEVIRIVPPSVDRARLGPQGTGSCWILRPCEDGCKTVPYNSTEGRCGDRYVQEGDR